MSISIGQRGSDSAWEPPPPLVLRLLEEYGPWVLLALLLVLIARALMHRQRYRALHMLAEADLERVHAALQQAERRTVGEIVPVVVERSDAHPSAAWLAALCTLLLGSALLEGVLPWTRPGWLLLCQLGLGAVGFAVAKLLPDVKRLLVRESRASEMAQEQALLEFHALGLRETVARTGVLLFVSLFERRVVVLADVGIAAKVQMEHWAATSDAVLEGIVRGSLRDGLIAGIERTGLVLGQHAPWQEGDRNELPDRLVVRRE